MSNTLYVDNDNLIILDGLQDDYPGETGFVNNATVTADVLDSSGSAVESGISMSYINGSDGKYVGVIEDGLSLTEGAIYKITVTVDAGSDKIAEFNETIRARERETS